ncbi:L-lysine exporter family protein LysE/ArgO [Microbacterium sp. SLBN-154]|uniref:LysE/ArgO family amino acid transporter n=1 Tax=Microbacterium sp. SLBN-154 TaxID=2768458 RepID=UPI00114EBD06|nr:LysE/ArgO family amino acid transporter [Microbacterium sp. SLBN-154]TQK20384.1 L-lysine exporter family protein LysE/ArgO [Microbacterium sp. SLBN-154]
MTLPLLAGLGLGFSLIIAIGAQNLFVLRQGLRREHVIIVAALCAVSDAVLIGIGVSGIGLLLQAVPWLVTAVRWTGAAFLIGYGLLAAHRAWRPSGQALTVRDEDASSEGATGRGAGAADVATTTRTRLLPVILTTLALTWLNPHVYLDTVFLLGSVANTHGDARWLFAFGAMAASVIWFFGLAIGARYLGRWLSTPASWRMLDGGVAVIMIALGVSLVLPH